MKGAWNDLYRCKWNLCNCIGSKSCSWSEWLQSSVNSDSGRSQIQTSKLGDFDILRFNNAIPEFAFTSARIFLKFKINIFLKNVPTLRNLIWMLSLYFYNNVILTMCQLMGSLNIHDDSDSNKNITNLLIWQMKTNSLGCFTHAFFSFCTFHRYSCSFHDAKWPVLQLCGWHDLCVQFCPLISEVLFPI